MLKKMSLRVKLFVLITLVVIVTFSSVSALVSSRSIQTAKEDAFLLADEISGKYSYEIKSELQAARVTSESLMVVFKTLIENGDADRDTLNAVLRNALVQKEYINIVSYCVAFEPNKLDGKDAEYAGEFPLYDETGRYAPYWSISDGVMDVEPLSDFDNDDWYAGARNSGTEYITDPFFFDVQGTPVLMASFVFPIMIDGEFIGIVSSDMALDSLQEMASQVNTSGFNEYTEIYSNSGIVVAHPEDKYFNKSIYATAAYNMLVSEPSKAQTALPIAKSHMENSPSPDFDDEAQVQEYDDAVAFVQNLADYAANPDGVALDLTLLTSEMARDILQLDKERLDIAEAAMEAVKNGESYSVVEDGYYKVYMPVLFSDATNPWSVAVSVPMSAVLKNSDEIRNYVILASVIGLAVIVIILYLVTRNLTQPILKLAYSAKRVGEGNFDVDIPEVESGDEVGILSAAFRTMIGQINDLVGKLTKNSEELEKRNEHLGELNVMLVEARDQAEASNRAKSEFLSNMSHEMRTPLNAIVGMAAIGQRAAEPEKKEDAFAKIEEASAHLLALVNDVLDMSKMEASGLEIASEEFNLDRVLGEVTDLFGGQMKEKGQTLSVDIDGNVPRELVGDAFRLSQVLTNLLSNAVKFTGERGEIGLRALVKESSDDLYTLQFEVSDTGIGISEEQRTRLFRMFEQADNSTSRSFGGTGLGLALSRRIVERMGGEIWLESELGRGSVFYFTVKLQRNAEGCGRECAAAPAEENCNFCGKRILLAEDIEINREIIISMLEATNVEIECAVNGKQAHEMLAADPSRYDLILMDIQMPVMDGVEATMHIRKINEDVPIIALTANVFKEDVDKYLESGMNGHIGKPLDFNQTMEILEKYLGNSDQ